MQALILAAGAGKRIKPIVTSKPFIPFGGRKLLDWVIGDLKAIGIKQFVVVVNPKDVNLTGYPTVVQIKPTGMAEAVLAARSLLAGPTIIINGDDLLDPKILQEFKQTVTANPDKICLTGLKVNKYFPGGYFQLKNNLITGIIEKPAAAARPSNFVNLVLHYFPKIEEFIKNLETDPSPKDDAYETVLNKMLQENPAILVKAKGYWQPLKKYPWQILDMTQTILNHRLKPLTHPSAQIHKTSVIEGTVQIEAGVKIMPYAIIKGPVYLGKQVIIGDHALVRNSLIEAGSVVGYKSEIVRSYVGPNNNFHANYVGDSVIEAGSNLGSGATLANLRFDKKEIIPGRLKLGAIMAQGSQLGVNVSVMPGVSLGAQSIVGSGLVLAKSLEAGEFKKN